MRYRTAILVCFFASLALPGQASITPIEGTTPVEIPAKLGDDSSFSGTVGLISSSQAHRLFMQSGVLKGDNHQPPIQSRQVSLALTTEFDLEAETPKYIAVKITGVKDPGTYGGNLYFFEPGKGTTPAVTVPIKLVVHSDPVVALCKGSDSMTLQFVRCFGVGCSLAGFLEPAAVLKSRFEYQGEFHSICLVNRSRESFSIGGDLQGRGVTNRETLGTALTIDTSKLEKVEPKSNFVNIPFHFVTVPAADHYIGSIDLTSADKPLVTVPLDVYVKSGPILPLFVLICGIFFGWLLKYMATKGQLQSDLLLKLYETEGEIAVSPPDQALLQPMIDDVKSEIYAMQLDAARTGLDAIQNRWTLLSRLRRLETTLDTQKANPAVLPILDNIQSARQQIAAGQDEQAAAEVAKIQTAVGNLHKATAPAAPQMALISRAKLQADKAGDAAAIGAKQSQSSKPQWWARIFRTVISVALPLRAELTLWLARPALYILLIFMLCSLGMQQLYVKNATFGANPLSDYFGLIMWAISSDVASRSLSNLKAGS